MSLLYDSSVQVSWYQVSSHYLLLKSLSSKDDTGVRTVYVVDLMY